MSYQAEKISGNQAKISFIVPSADFDAAMQQSYLKNRGRINVPGFRKGKAPRKLIENMYGESVFYDDAFEAIFLDLYDEAIEKEDLFPVDQPTIDNIEQMSSGKDLKFSVTVYIKPDVELGNYKGLKATRHLHPVSQEEIDHRISHDVQKVTTKQDISDRPVQDGDTVNIDYKGSVNGEYFVGGEGHGHSLTLGSGSFIPGFEEQLIGLNVGDEKTITVTFPEKYHAEDLAGKEARFEVKINAATEEIKPELDDDFAQDVSEYKTFEEYKAAILKELEDHRDKNAETQVENQLIQQAVDAADCDIPEAMINRQIDRLLQNMQIQMMYQGIRMEDYLRYTNTTQDDLRQQMRSQAEMEVKLDLVIEAIAKAENIEASQEEVDHQIELRAKEMGADLDKYKAGLTENQLFNYQDLVKSRKVVELIKENADITVHDGHEAEDHIDAQQILEQVQDALEDAGVEEDDPKEKKTTKKTTKKTKKDEEA